MECARSGSRVLSARPPSTIAGGQSRVFQAAADLDVEFAEGERRISLLQRGRDRGDSRGDIEINVGALDTSWLVTDEIRHYVRYRNFGFYTTYGRASRFTYRLELLDAQPAAPLSPRHASETRSAPCRTAGRKTPSSSSTRRQVRSPGASHPRGLAGGRGSFLLARTRPLLDPEQSTRVFNEWVVAWPCTPGVLVWRARGVVRPPPRALPLLGAASLRA